MEYNVQHTSVNLQIVQSHGIRAFVYVYIITLPFRGARCPETVVAKIIRADGRAVMYIL